MASLLPPHTLVRRAKLHPSLPGSRNLFRSDPYLRKDRSPARTRAGHAPRPHAEESVLKQLVLPIAARLPSLLS